MDIRVNVFILHFIYVSLFSTVTGREITDEDLHKFPRLFHLDNFERCLSQRDGLYCLGTFELTASQPLPILELMKEYTNQPFSFNRTLLQRGYCVSERCPSLRSEQNATLRFEGCVERYARRYELTVRLKDLQYCITHQQRQEEAIRAPNTEQMLFLYAVAVILLFNVVGTLYHCYMRDDSKKNNYLMAWSLRSNWARFTKIEEGGRFAALAPLQGIRLTLQWVLIMGHTVFSHYLVYVHNAEYLEKLPSGLFGSVFRNGTSIVQVFILISSFLTGYNLLFVAQTIGVSSTMLIKWILKRLARILPVYLLVLGYAVSWWPRSGDSPQLLATVGKESQVCRNKFWPQVLFINNIVEPHEMCLLQSWAFAVDMQLYIVSTLLTLLLKRLKVRAVPILSFLFAASVGLNVVLAYVNGWVPLVKVIRPKILRDLFREPSLHKPHISAWGNLPGCFLGLLMAHFYFEKVKKKAKVKDETVVKKSISNSRPNNEDGNNISTKNWEGERNDLTENGMLERKELIGNLKEERNGLIENGKEERKEPTKNLVGEYIGPTRNGVIVTTLTKLVRNGHNYAIPVCIAWASLTVPIGTSDSLALTALHVGLERVVFTVLASVFLIQVFTADNFIRRIMTWRGWQALGRLSFSVMLLHWCITLSLVAGRSEVIGTSLFYIIADYLAILCFSHLLALPVCLLVELPAQKFLDLLISVPSSVVRF